MSSHHFVRENQEPALIIANGEACSEELLGQLLEWSPLVVVLDEAINRVLALGIKVDVWLGDFDRNPDFEAIRQRMHPLEIIETPDQNKTDLEKAIELVIGRNFTGANIVWATGRRADHNITNITCLVRYRKQIRLVIWDDYSKIFPLTNTFEKWYEAKTPISLIPVGNVEGVITSGLKYNLSDEPLSLGFRSGSSNEALVDGFVRISARRGEMLIMECHD